MRVGRRDSTVLVCLAPGASRLTRRVESLDLGLDDAAAKLGHEGNLVDRQLFFDEPL